MTNPEYSQFNNEFENSRDNLLENFKQLSERKTPESREFYESSLDKATEILKTEKGIIELNKNVPTIVVSDIHARPEFLIKLLEKELDIDGKKVKVFDLFKNNQINIVCVGDGMHTSNAKAWQEPDFDFDKEMADGLCVMKMAMDLKINFPNNFHFLRGNHEDIYSGAGKEGVHQINQTRDWFEENFGLDFVKKWSRFEKSLPIIAKGENFVVTHAAPDVVHAKESVELKDINTVYAYTTSENRFQEPNPVAETQFREKIDGNLRNLNMPEDSKWFIGHRTTGDKLYRSQFDGQLIQINKDDGFVVAIIPNNEEFDPEKDVIDLKQE